MRKIREGNIKSKHGKEIGNIRWSMHNLSDCNARTNVSNVSGQNHLFHFLGIYQHKNCSYRIAYLLHTTTYSIHTFERFKVVSNIGKCNRVVCLVWFVTCTCHVIINWIWRNDLQVLTNIYVHPQLGNHVHMKNRRWPCLTHILS